MFTRFLSKRLFSHSSKQLIDMQFEYGCHNYGPLPIVAAKGEGPYLWDQEGKKYYDLIAGIGGCNQGHVHPKILKAFIQQASQLTLVSRAIYNNQLGLAQKRLRDLFGYDKSIFMNGGVESGETAVKMARRWGYNVKNIPDKKAQILFPKGNFWGRTIAACGSSDDPLRYQKFGPFQGLGFSMVEYDNVQALQKALSSNPNIAAYFTEPIQGQRGVIIPSQGYLKQVQRLCKKYNVLFICDEVQTGFGRTGKMFGFEHEGVRPDLVCLGKSFSGGFLPVSAVLGNNQVMDQIKPGEHGSTFGGNPLAAKTAIAAVDVIIQEKLCQNSQKMGKLFLQNLKKIFTSSGRNGKNLKQVRGLGLFMAIEFHQNTLADKLSKRLLANGIICKPTNKQTLKITPTLVLTQTQVYEITSIFQKSWNEVEQI